MTDQNTKHETELEIKPSGSGEAIIVKGNLATLHDNPQKVHQLLDLLGMPKGTEVRVTTRATSMMVR